MICHNKNIVDNLTDDLLKPKYRGSNNKYWGHCYVATEAAYYLYGKKENYKPHYIKINGDTHWFLKRGKDIIDLTKNQFNFDVDYSKSRGCGFLSSKPSKRCKILLNRICI